MTEIQDILDNGGRLDTPYNVTEMPGNDTDKILINETDQRHVMAERADVGLTHAASR